MEKRRCDYCEYYCKRSSYSPAKCLFNPPRVSGEHNTGKFPDTHDDHFCSKWEPKWHENSSIQEAWEQFVMVHKIIISGEGEH